MGICTLLVNTKSFNDTLWKILKFKTDVAIVYNIDCQFFRGVASHFFLLSPWAQLFEGRLAFNPWFILTRFPFLLLCE